MLLRKSFLKSIVLVGFTALAIGIGSTTSHAAEKANTANTLKVSPVRTDIVISPGETKIVKTTVSNLTNQPMTVRPVQNDFVAGDERGTPALILDEDQYAPTHSLKRFMTPLEDVLVPANQSKLVEVEIIVPESAQAGGYFGAIRFAPTSPDSGGQVNLSASVASLILLTVPGPSVEKVALSDFDILQNGKSANFIQIGDNLQATFRFENQGNVQIGPFGKISVVKGDGAVYEVDFNESSPREVILPNSARRWEVPLSDISGFGKYTVNATFTYGQDNQTIEVNKSFWLVPPVFIYGAIALVVALFALAIGVWLKRRRNKYRAPGRR